MRSIRARLLIGLLASVLAVQFIMYLLTYARIEDEIDDLFDGELERSALSAGSTGRSSRTAPPTISVIGASTRARPRIQPSATARPCPARPPFQPA